ncbi:934_t:CDS:1, partial [Gigaspora margarita]
CTRTTDEIPRHNDETAQLTKHYGITKSNVSQKIHKEKKRIQDTNNGEEIILLTKRDDNNEILTKKMLIKKLTKKKYQ